MAGGCVGATQNMETKMKINARIVTIGVFAAWSLVVTPILRAQPATSLAPAYRLVDIGVIPGGTDYSYATAVNNANKPGCRHIRQSQSRFHLGRDERLAQPDDPSKQHGWRRGRHENK